MVISIIYCLKYLHKNLIFFFDGNHSKKATLKYFNWALENFMEEAIMFLMTSTGQGMKEADRNK